MIPDDDLLAISALQHLVYCERQCMLIHVEGAWAENRTTAQGRIMHERVHAERSGMEDGRLIARGLRLCSRRLGLSGVADVVEFHPAQDETETVAERAAASVAIAGRAGRWRPFPVEYKRGRPKKHDADKVQLCAQAMCLEEMLATFIERGALFYGQTRRRQDVTFDASLRGRVESLAARLHALVTAGVTPPPDFGGKCDNCSLKDLCLPKRPASAMAYLRRAIRASLSET